MRTTKKIMLATPREKQVTTAEKRFYADVATMLREGRTKTYAAINFVMVETYWNIGRRIVEQEQKGKERAGYGEYLITGLSRHLGDTFGKGFSEANLWNMRQFYTTFPDFGQFSTHRVENSSSTQFPRQCLENSDSTQFPRQCLANLSWSNICAIMRLTNPKERDYYIREAAAENWSFRVLERNIRTGYYRRLLSSQIEGAVRKTPTLAIPNIAEFVKDPVVLEFLNIPDDLRGKETVLENALITNLQKFLLELGKGFSFIARQMRISTETDHFYADLVFYNYLLKCFVIIDLKTAKLTHQDIGQMDMYVRMFDALKRGKDDNPTIGIILCAEKSETMARYSVLKESRQLFAAKYMPILPTEEELAEELARNTRYLLEAKGGSHG